MRAREQEGRSRPPVEVGEEPPIALGDSDPSRYSRRGVSLRWLFGAVVTGITSVALMGGALVAALDGRYVVEAVAAVPEARASPHSRRAAKGDLVRTEHEPVSSRRVIEVSTVVRQGGEDLIAKRPYALVSASLVLDKDEIGNIPSFNPRELATRQDPPVASATDAIYDKAVDGEITVSVEAFPLDEDVPFDSAMALQEPEIERQLLQEQFPAVAASPGAAVEVEAFLDPATATPPNVTVVPENVSELFKTNEPLAGEAEDAELVELVQPGDTLTKILRGSGIATGDIEAIAAVLEGGGVARLRTEQTLRVAFQLDEDDDVARRRPSRLTIYEDGAHLATVAMTDEGRFVPGEAPPGPAPVVEDAVAPTSEARLPTTYESLYQTLVDHELPEPVRDVVLATFSLDTDFNARVRPGDRVTVLHAADEAGDGAAEILFAALTAAGVERRFYRFKTPDGVVDYYDEDGRTGDKFLMRKPMARGVFRSGFGMRNHPILRRRRMHNGVDYAAPRGTPIYAAGDGVVKQAGWKAGYGRWVSIRHKNGYETGYAHQSRIAKGIRPGVRVEQGQIIGYVGSTGFSTGPHLHYEVHVNGRPVNPLKIRLRRGRELSGAELAAFERERDRIDALISENAIEVARR